MNTEFVKASKLENGDIVWTHGMRVRISNGREKAYSDPVAYVFDGEILNGDDVPFSDVPRQFRGEDGKSWTIQSNDRFAGWSREV